MHYHEAYIDQACKEDEKNLDNNSVVCWKDEGAAGFMINSNTIHLPNDWLPEYTLPVNLKNVLSNTSLETPTHRSKKFLKILNDLEECCNNIGFAQKNHVQLNENNYLTFLKLAAYIEEHNMNSAIEEQSYIKQEIYSDRSNLSSCALFSIGVMNIDEYPCVRKGDFIDVCDKNIVYTLTVLFVNPFKVFAVDKSGSFEKVYNRKNLYNIKFRLQNYSLRCNHYALGIAKKSNLINYLFPYKSKPFINNDTTDYKDVRKWFNKGIKANPEQKQAVTNILNRSSFPAPYILYGPPGTGKTTTLVEAICQIHEQSSNNRVLVYALSNAGADEITKQLLSYINIDNLYRIYNSIDLEPIDEELKVCSNYQETHREQLKHKIILMKKIFVSTLNSIACVNIKHSIHQITHILIDDAGQGTESDILIPLVIASKDGQLYSQVVLAGDPHQIGPTVLSKIGKTIIGRSILERLMAYDTYSKDRNGKYNAKYITKLLYNYRCDPNIMRVSNELFYDNELISRFQDDYKHDQHFPVQFYGVEGTEEKVNYSISIWNAEEIRIVLSCIDDLLEGRKRFKKTLPKDIGIVTPFVLQGEKIRMALLDRGIDGIAVGTVESFQGQEKKIMIMTTVRSTTFFHEGQEHIGILSDPKRFNVALTRAKNVLIVVGNPNVLQQNYMWRYLIEFCTHNESYYGSSYTPIISNFDENKQMIEVLIECSQICSEDYKNLFTSADWEPALNRNKIEHVNCYFTNEKNKNKSKHRFSTDEKLIVESILSSLSESMKTGSNNIVTGQIQDTEQIRPEIELMDEANWIYRHGFGKNPMLLITKRDLNSEATDPENGKIPLITKILDFTQNKKYSIAALMRHQWKIFLPYFEELEIVRIINLDRDWHQIIARKIILANILEELQGCQSIQESKYIKRVTDKDLELIQSATTMQEVNDCIGYLAIHYGHQVFDVLKITKSSDNIKSIETYSQLLDSGINDIIRNFGMSSTQIAENIFQGKIINTVEREPIMPRVLATEYVNEHFKNVEEVLKGAIHMMATQISVEPLFRKRVRKEYLTRALVKVRLLAESNQINRDRVIDELQKYDSKELKKLNTNDYYKLLYYQEKGVISINLFSELEDFFEESKKLIESYGCINQDAWRRLRIRSLELGFQTFLSTIEEELQSKFKNDAVDLEECNKLKSFHEMETKRPTFINKSFEESSIELFHPTQNYPEVKKKTRVTNRVQKRKRKKISFKEFFEASTKSYTKYKYSIWLIATIGAILFIASLCLICTYTQCGIGWLLYILGVLGLLVFPSCLHRTWNFMIWSLMILIVEGGLTLMLISKCQNSNITCPAITVMWNKFLHIVNYLKETSWN